MEQVTCPSCRYPRRADQQPCPMCKKLEEDEKRAAEERKSNDDLYQ
jgi:hypothetical protein